MVSEQASDEAELAVFRVVQEALSNTRRHAPTLRTGVDGASIRLRGGLLDRSTVDLLSPGPGNSVRPAVQELNEGAFVTGLAAGHVEAVRVVGADMMLGDVEPVEGDIFIIPIGSERTSALEVEGIDADGEVLGTWDPQDLSHRR